MTAQLLKKVLADGTNSVKIANEAKEATERARQNADQTIARMHEQVRSYVKENHASRAIAARK